MDIEIRTELIPKWQRKLCAGYVRSEKRACRMYGAYRFEGITDECFCAVHMKQLAGREFYTDEPVIPPGCFARRPWVG
jgi:hypothetical protein